MSEVGRRRLEALCCASLRRAAPPALADDWLAAGQQLHAIGEREAALAAFELGAALDETRVDAWLAVATLRCELGRPGAALEACNCALTLAPEHPGALLNTGLLLRFIGDQPAALFTFDKLLALTPEMGAARLARAQTLASLQRLDEAAEAFADCLECPPGEAQAAFGLADVELARGCFQAAADIFEVLLADCPQWTAARISLALACVGLDDDARADALLAQAKRDDPQGCANYRPFFAADLLGGRAVLESQRFRVALEFTALFRCQWRRRESFLRWLEGKLTGGLGGEAIEDPDIPFLALGLEISPQARLNLARNVAGRLTRGRGARVLRQRAKKAGSPIRLGYLSGDMREHPIGRLLSRIFGLHDRECFEVFVYHSGPREVCEPRRRAEEEADVFRDVQHFAAEAVAALVAADGIDILVDLSGYTLFNRTAALALRPAPVQVAYLGYFGTLGGKLADYVVADHDVLLAEQRPFWNESIAWLPDSFFLCDDTLAPPIGQVVHSDFGLPETGFVFACLNATWKIEPAIFEVWMRVLKQVPHSVLWLFDGGSPYARAALMAEAAARGVGAERLVFAEHAEYSAYLQRYQVVDLVLNTLTYNGNTTTIEALAMGVPVLTLAGSELPARAAAGLLWAHGLPELVVATTAEYESVACRLAESPAELERLRGKIAANRPSSRLFCTERRVREMESAYRMMWERHLAGLPPADFDVPPLQE